MRGGAINMVPSVSAVPQAYICGSILVDGPDIVAATTAAAAAGAGNAVGGVNYNLLINGSQINMGSVAAAGAAAGKDYTLYLYNGKLYAVVLAKLPVVDNSHISVHTV